MYDKRICLRAPEPEDIDFLYQLENDTANWTLSENSTPLSRYAIEQYILSCEQDFFVMKQLRMIITTNDTEKSQRIGTVELFDADAVNLRAGIGIIIIPEKQKLGYAKAILKMMHDYVFNTLGLHQLYCNISEDNLTSLALFRKMGYKDIGLKKHWLRHNQIWKNVFMLQFINE